MLICASFQKMCLKPFELKHTVVWVVSRWCCVRPLFNEVPGTIFHTSEQCMVIRALALANLDSNVSKLVQQVSASSYMT